MASQLFRPMKELGGELMGWEVNSKHLLHRPTRLMNAPDGHECTNPQRRQEKERRNDQLECFRRKVRRSGKASDKIKSYRDYLHSFGRLVFGFRGCKVQIIMEDDVMSVYDMKKEFFLLSKG